MAYIGNTPTTQSFISGTDYFNGNASTVAFTLSRSVASVNDIEVVVNNVIQQPNSAYAISGTTITFTGAPSAGTNNVYVRYLSTTTQTITPSQGTVSPESLSVPNAVYWDASGNVGVGTVSPSQKLDVAGGRIRTAGSTGNSGYIQIFNNANTTGQLQLGQGLASGTDNVGYLWNIANADISFGTNNVEHTRLNSNSALTIAGGSQTNGRLVVKGVNNYSGGIAVQDANSSSRWEFVFGGDYNLYFGFDGFSKGYFSQTTGTYTALSDARRKKNIVNSTSGLAAILALRPVQYNMLEEDNSTQQHIGFLAQEAMLVIPSSVTEMMGGTLGMDKQELIPVLVKAIQEQQAIIEDLKARLVTLEAR